MHVINCDQGRSAVIECDGSRQVVKVFHGAESDVAWLQRDFGIFIVNMFDTHQAGIVLGLPHLGLAHLLKTYCSVQVCVFWAALLASKLI